ncbi:unannotated protein [freshwater metagenome]|uniref:Unannotated protein n=1 Tax=freshwater metagenome TaxID=449393 RepID=A0A6J7UTH6_9ZZZZ
MRVGHQTWPRHHFPHRNAGIGDALARELQFSAGVVVIQLHTHRHLRHIVVNAQAFLPTQLVLNNESVVNAVVVDIPPRLFELWPYICTHMVLHRGKHHWAQLCNRHFMARHRVVWVCLKCTRCFCSIDEHLAIRRCEKRQHIHLTCQFAHSFAQVGSTFVVKKLIHCCHAFSFA